MDKWFAHLRAAVDAEVEGVVQVLASRIQTLEERYAHPMPDLTQQVADCAERVEKHLKKMGLEW